VLLVACAASHVQGYSAEEPRTLVGEWVGSWSYGYNPGYNNTISIIVTDVVGGFVDGHIEFMFHARSSNIIFPFRSGTLDGNTLKIPRLALTLEINGRQMAGKGRTANGGFTCSLGKLK
jgi:hypothetical protein